MSSRTSLRVIAATLFVVLMPSFSVGRPRTRAQDTKQHHQYRLVDIGTLGGPNSYLPGGFFEGQQTQSLSAAGTFAGSAESAIPDPFDVCFYPDCLVGHAVQWRGGTLTDLGTLPGTGELNSTSTWMSSNGLIVGVSENGDIDPTVPGFPVLHGVLWKNGKITDLGTLEGGYESIAQSVNSRGQVVGLAVNGIPDDYSIVGFPTETRAFRWQNGTMQDLGTLPGGTDAVALYINDYGQIVGQSYTVDSFPSPGLICGDVPLTLHAFFWQNGQMVDLGTLGGSCAAAYALNNLGQVVGQATLAGDNRSHPYIWRGGKMTDLGALGGDYGFATQLNDAGQVVGAATDPGDQALLAFSWKTGKISNLGALPGDHCSGADAINSTGQVVGGSGSFNPDYFPACTDPVEHAVLWEKGGILDLDNFVPPGNDLTLNEAFSINDSGVISGVGTLPNGNVHAFLLIPCDQSDGAGGCEDGAQRASARSSVSVARSQPFGRTVRNLPGIMRSQRGH